MDFSLLKITGVHSAPVPGVTTENTRVRRFTVATCLRSISVGDVPVLALKLSIFLFGLMLICSHINDPGVSKVGFPPEAATA